jgi:hypothetical protein
LPAGHADAYTDRNSNRYTDSNANSDTDSASYANTYPIGTASADARA